MLYFSKRDAFLNLKYYKSVYTSKNALFSKGRFLEATVEYTSYVEKSEKRRRFNFENFTFAVKNYFDSV